MRIFIGVCAISIIIPVESLDAQVRPGQRVRVTHQCIDSSSFRRVGAPTSCRSVGILDVLAADSLVVAADAGSTETVIPIVEVVQFEVSSGRKHVGGRAVLIGLGIGAAVGALASAPQGNTCGDEEPMHCSVIGATFGGMVGVAIGAVVGRFVKMDRWEEVPLDRLRVGLAPRRGGRFAFGLSVAF